MQLANYGQQIRRLARMVEGGPAKVLRPSAAPHVVAMDGVASFESGLCQTPGVTGGAGSFQAMHHNQFSGGRGGQRLRMHQDLDAGFGFVQPGFDGEALFIQLPLPVVAGDGEEVRVSEEGDERGQETILRNLWRKKLGSVYL